VDDAFSNIINSLLWLPVPFAARTCKRYLLMAGLFSDDSQKYSENKSAFKFNVYLRICSNTPRRRLELYPRPVRPTKVNDTFYSFLPHDAVLCGHIVSRTRTRTRTRTRAISLDTGPDSLGTKRQTFDLPFRPADRKRWIRFWAIYKIARNLSDERHGGKRDNPTHSGKKRLSRLEWSFTGGMGNAL